MPQRASNSASVNPPQSRIDNNPGTRANLNYLDQLAKFHKQHGTNLNRFPSVDKRPLDLYKLKKAVEVRGGFDAVCKTKKWAEIGRDLGYSGKIMSSLSTSLKNSYQRWLQPYEEYLRVAKPGVHQQLEFENGGPFTPSPHQSPVAKRPPSTTPSNNRPESPAIRATLALNKSIELDGTPDGQTPSSESAPRPTGTSGFTAVNAKPGGFTPVNQSPSFVAVNAAPQVKKEMDSGTPTPRLADTPLSSRPDSVDQKPGHSSTPVVNGNGARALKRAISHDSLGGSSQNEGADGDSANSRRSKRLRKGKIQFF
jgi:[histone H3]-trimethyl-L-lysine4 demethylase